MIYVSTSINQKHWYCWNFIVWRKTPGIINIFQLPSHEMVIRIQRTATDTQGIKNHTKLSNPIWLVYNSELLEIVDMKLNQRTHVGRHRLELDTFLNAINNTVINYAELRFQSFPKVKYKRCKYFWSKCPWINVFDGMMVFADTFYKLLCKRRTLV